MAGQLSRYGTVGLVSNALLYGAYLALTAGGLGHKVSMTIVFATGIVMTYFVNRSWSFDFSGGGRLTFVKYATVYISTYLLSLLIMWLSVDISGLPHQFVQLFLIFFCAGLIFLSLRFWVFRDRDAISRKG